MFRDRKDAGEKLAAALERMIAEDPSLKDPVIFALPRGGAPVAFEIAQRLNAPLDLVLVRKIGVPGQPELAAGAVVDGDDPQMVENAEVIAMAGLTRADLEAGKRKGLAEIERRREMYFKGRERAPVKGRTAIVVDDGIATGATMQAALKGLRMQGPAKLVLAVPVAPPESLDRLRGDVDRALCLETPDWFMAVGAHYAVFDQTPDAEVVRLLEAAQGFGKGPEKGA
jgi:putative phosphoribosyl transferase